MSSFQHDSVREGARRLHRQIALFGVLFCWKNGLDALRILKEDLHKIIGITRVEESRLKWMYEDVHDYFPYFLKRLI